MDLVSVASAAIGAEVQLFLAAQKVLGQDLAESIPEILYAVSIDDGVDCRVGVGQNYGYIHDSIWLFQLPVQQRKAVEDVDRQPADSEQSHDDGEGFGGPDLFLQQPVVMAVPVAHTLKLNLSQLLPGNSEDLQVDAQHDDQRQQHTHKKIKVDHVAHVHHTLKVAPELATPQCASSGALPLHEGRICSVVRPGAAVAAAGVL